MLSQVMYPTMVIVLVNNQRTFDHMYSKNTSHLPSHSVDADRIATLQFAQFDPVTSAGTFPREMEQAVIPKQFSNSTSSM